MKRFCDNCAKCECDWKEFHGCMIRTYHCQATDARWMGDPLPAVDCERYQDKGEEQ